MSEHYHLFYEFAYYLAYLAYQEDEVPIGAVIIKDDTKELIASSYNQMKANKSSIDHAEILALKLAMAKVNNERLNGFSMITTLEPCPMCAQAISFARLTNIIRINDNDKSKKLLQQFFQNKRKNKRI